MSFKSGYRLVHENPEGSGKEEKCLNFTYDKEGNLTRKVEESGDTWFYAYYGNGILKLLLTTDKRFKEGSRWTNAQ
uniref:hypothetical protein n=1 Tax=Enterocloster clostridioformis TaxID=1531 RepID=UPI0026E36654